MRVILLCLFSISVLAGPREQAYTMHNRLTGIPPEKNVLDQMEVLIAGGRAEEAAYLAMNNPAFYNVNLKRWIKPWTNEEQSERVPLNDFVATVIGVIRDDIRFDSLLYADIAYSAPDNMYQNGDDNMRDDFREDSNRHYERLERENQNLAAVLIQRTQSERYSEVQEHAGILTTRAAGMAFYDAGTNRAVTRFTFINWMCKDFEELHDINVPDFLVRRDVERTPGGDSRVYRNTCAGCHAGQDALGGAFAYLDWDGNNLEQSNNVVGKINNLVNFPEGHMVQDNSFVNLWATGQNASLGWRGATTGAGPRQFGQMLARSRAFSECMARRAYKFACQRELSPTSSLVDTLADGFENQSTYNMKRLIANASTTCMGE